MFKRIACGLVLAAALVAGPAAAQEVRSFIDPSDAAWEPRFATPEDLEYVQAVGRAFKVTMSEKGEIAICQWRSPLVTPGAYVDGSNWGGYGFEFYMRLPVPRSALVLRNATLAPRPEFSRVAYLEVVGRRDIDKGVTEWRRADLVLPPLALAGAGAGAGAGASRFGPVFTVAQIKAGDYLIRTPNVARALPGLPVRIRIAPAEFEKMLTAWQTNGAFSAGVSRMTRADDPAAVRADMTADYSALNTDLPMIYAKLAQMRARDAQNTCKVFGSSCKGGRCG